MEWSCKYIRKHFYCMTDILCVCFKTQNLNFKMQFSHHQVINDEIISISLLFTKMHIFVLFFRITVYCKIIHKCTNMTFVFLIARNHDNISNLEEFVYAYTCRLLFNKPATTTLHRCIGESFWITLSLYKPS